MNANLAETRSPEDFLRIFSTKLRERLGDKTNPTILIQGGFGKNNTGDTLLLVAEKKFGDVSRSQDCCQHDLNLFNLYDRRRILWFESDQTPFLGMES